MEKQREGRSPMRPILRVTGCDASGWAGPARSGDESDALRREIGEDLVDGVALHCAAEDLAEHRAVVDFHLQPAGAGEEVVVFEPGPLAEDLAAVDLVA